MIKVATSTRLVRARAVQSRWYGIAAIATLIVAFHGTPAQAAWTNAQWGTFNWGAYTIENDVYNPPGGWYDSSDPNNSQAIWNDYTGGWGGNWTYNRYASSPVSFIAAYRGWHWGAYSPDSGGFPVQVGQNAMMPTSVSYSASGNKYDVAYDFFLNSNPYPGSSDPQAEIMVWLSTNGGPQPAGSPAAYGISLGNVQGTYDVWYKGWGGSPNWPVISYVRRDQQTSTGMYLQPFVWWAANSRNWISNSQYILGVEFGLENYSGSGSIDVTSYSASAH